LRFFNGSPGSLVPVVADLLMLRCSIEHSIATPPMSSFERPPSAATATPTIG
jgi:hypothetical protein